MLVTPSQNSVGVPQWTRCPRAPFEHDRARTRYNPSMTPSGKEPVAKKVRSTRVRTAVACRGEVVELGACRGGRIQPNPTGAAGQVARNEGGVGAGGFEPPYAGLSAR